MANRIITIEREYASGGREIGKKVAEKLGIPFYNREILELAAEKCGVSPEHLENAEEVAPKSFLYSLMLSSNPTRSIEENLPLSYKIYIIESKIIQELASKSDCVIVGRCANYILGHTQDVFSVFIYSNKEDRERRAVADYSIDPKKASSIIKKFDKRRETFYSINTGGNWYDKENYAMCLNSGKLGIDFCSKLILDAVNNMKRD
jgi:cytidylate kinase